MKRVFTPTTWSDMWPDQEVYLMGTKDGDPYPYGPYRVVEPSKRTLINSKGRVFTHYPEELAVEVSP